jgi:aspartate-semialdehyde dehydrogenase
MPYNIAVVGATGNVGRVILDILSERQFPINEIHAIASSNSKGKQISFGEQRLVVQSLDHFDFNGIDIAFFSPGSKVSAQFAPIAAKSCIVIDNTSHFRMDKTIPLVVPEVNAWSIANYETHNIIANPNCVALPITVALAPLHKISPIKRIVVTSFQSVSGAGKAQMDELYTQTKGKYMNSNIPPHKFPKQIAFNLIPHIGDFNDDGYTQEEQKVADEIQKILDQNIQVTATCVRVPVFVGHSISINVEFEDHISAEDARNALEEQNSIVVMDNPEFSNYCTPVDCVGEDPVFISRIREDKSLKNGLNLWIVSDNLRKGAALNAVQIAEELINNYL